jgi:hypothetical protein
LGRKRALEGKKGTEMIGFIYDESMTCMTREAFEKGF